jgi:RRXRR protein
LSRVAAAWKRLPHSAGTTAPARLQAGSRAASARFLVRTSLRRDNHDAGLAPTLRTDGPQGERHQALEGRSARPRCRYSFFDKRNPALMACPENRARLLLERGRAVVVQRYPFTIRRKDRIGGEACRRDPGSKATSPSSAGMAATSRRARRTRSPRPADHRDTDVPARLAPPRRKHSLVAARRR